MKIFGGGGYRRKRPAAAARPKKVKKTHSIVKKVLLGILLAILAVAVAGGIYVAAIAKPPSLAEHVNDSTIKDPENGDMPSVDLNMGDRIDDFFTFVVCATDIDETRTDNIMVIAFDTKEHTMNVMNIPRDTMSNVNKTGANRKINAAYGTRQGIEQTKKQVKQVMGFTPDKYIVVNFQGIADIVDAIGGVDYEIPFPMMYSDPVQKLEIKFPEAGMRHLNGEEVVEFLRWRKNGTGYTQYVPAEYKNGDETRIAKQQEFLKYLAKKVLTLKNAVNARGIAQAVFNNVKTDITAGEMLWLAGQAFQIKTDTGINMFTLPGYSAMSTAGNDTELSFYFVNERESLKLINEYFNPYDKKITSLDLVSGPTKGSGKSSSRSEDDEDEDSSYSLDYDDEDEENTSSENDSPSSSRDDDEGDADSGNSNNSGNSNSSDNSGNSGSESSGSSGNSGSSGGSSESGSSGDSGSSGNSSGDSGSSGSSGESSGDSGSSGSAGGESAGEVSEPSAPVNDPEA